MPILQELATRFCAYPHAICAAARFMQVTDSQSILAPPQRPPCKSRMDEDRSLAPVDMRARYGPAVLWEA